MELCSVIGGTATLRFDATGVHLRLEFSPR
jgi:hypothetical protein